MRSRFIVWVLLLLVGCVSPKGDDDRLDAGPGAKRGDGGIASIGPSAGAAARASESYRLRVVVGAPTPAGRRESSSYRMLLGAGVPKEAIRP